MKVSYRNVAKAKKKLAEGRKLKPAEYQVIKTAAFRNSVNRVKASKNIRTAMAAASSAIQMAVINATPVFGAANNAFTQLSKTLKMVAMTLDAAEHIKKIQQEPLPTYNNFNQQSHDKKL